MVKGMFDMALQRAPLYRQIYADLESRILKNELRVGDSMPAEQTLADGLQVHRSSVREALRLLEENGLVARRPGGKKLFVQKPDRRKLGTRISNAFVLEEVSFNELYEGIRVIDTSIGVAAAEKISDRLLDQLEENLRQTELNMNNREALLELDAQFHDLIAEGSCNRVLQMSRLGISQVFFRAAHRLMSQLNVNHRLLEAHRQIYAGLRAHDPEQVRIWTLKHTDDFKRGYEVAGLNLHETIKVDDL
ncbi:MAG: GntR family transcriptional regulator [Pseudomonadota bacterium]